MIVQSRALQLFLAAVLFVFGVGVLMVLHRDTGAPRFFSGLFAVVALFAAAGFAAPVRLRWALRIAAGFVTATYLAFFLGTLYLWFRHDEPGARIFGALLGLIVFGLPCLAFALSDRDSPDIPTNDSADTDQAS